MRCVGAVDALAFSHRSCVLVLLFAYDDGWVGGVRSGCASAFAARPASSASRERPSVAPACCLTDCQIPSRPPGESSTRSEEHTSELQSQFHLVCRLLLEKKKKDGGCCAVWS